MARLGNNLNQHARWATRHQSEVDALVVCQALVQLERMVVAFAAGEDVEGIWDARGFAEQEDEE